MKLEGEINLTSAKFPPAPDTIFFLLFGFCFDIFLIFRFEMEPIASASIAQVHRAWLKDGTQVRTQTPPPFPNPTLFRSRVDLWLHSGFFIPVAHREAFCLFILFFRVTAQSAHGCLFIFLGFSPPSPILRCF